MIATVWQQMFAAVAAPYLGSDADGQQSKQLVSLATGDKNEAEARVLSQADQTPRDSGIERGVKAIANKRRESAIVVEHEHRTFAGRHAPPV
jgi:hypothetical protein